MQNQTPVNKSIVESRMEMHLTDYLQKCIEHLESLSDKGLLQGMGELMDNKMKKNIQMKMLPEVIELLKFYKKFPIL
ncbi:hypothetical protein ES708_33334 [subsurface metagenome]